MIRVLQVVGTMDLGGAETFIMNIYRNIDRSKVQFDFLCHNRIEAKYTDEIISMGGKMFCVPGMSHVGFLKYQKNLYEFFLKHQEYRVVHAHQNDLNGIILKQAKKAKIQHRYSHSHTVYLGKNFLHTMRFCFFRRYFENNVTSAYACSIPAGNELYRKELKENFEVVPNGIDTERFRFNRTKRIQIRDDLQIGNGPVIGHVGRFAAVKNHVFILEVFNQYLKKEPEATLILIGEGELLEKMKEVATEQGILEHVRFLGSRRDIPECMSAMDLFLFPSINEGLPVSVVEAQASGLLVLTSDSISQDTVITDLVQRFSLDEDAEKWAEILQGMYAKSVGKDRLSYADIVRKQGFDAADTAKKFEKLYLYDYMN